MVRVTMGVRWAWWVKPFLALSYAYCVPMWPFMSEAQRETLLGNLGRFIGKHGAKPTFKKVKQ